MALDATKVRVALTGHIWVGDENMTIPTDVNTAPSGADDLGYTSEDGVTFTIGRETEDIMGWQSMEPLRRIVTSEPKTAAFTLRQTERAVLLNSLGGSITSTGSGLYRWEPDEGNIPVKVLLIDFEDGDLKYRFGFRRAQQLGEIETNFVRNNAVNWPNEWSCLAGPTGEKSWFIDSNDPAMGDVES